MNIFGHNFRLAIWGESHGPQIGISVDGLSLIHISEPTRP